MSMSELMNFNPKTCVRIPVTTLPREEVLAIFYGKDYTEQKQDKDKVTHVIIDLTEVNHILDKSLEQLQDYILFV